MGYTTQVSDDEVITITPPIPWSRFKGSEFYTASPWNADTCVFFKVMEQIKGEGDDEVVVRVATAVVASDDELPVDHLERHLQEVIDKFPEHVFTGHFTIDPYESGDNSWRMAVGSDRKVHHLEPVITWPEVP